MKFFEVHFFSTYSAMEIENIGNKYLKIHFTTSYSWNKITFQSEKNSKLL